MIIRVEKRERFLIIDKRATEDPRLSFKARGVLAFLLGKPDGWRISYLELANHSKDGKHATRMALKELEDAGYLTRSRFQGEKGKWRTEVTLREEPEGGFPQSICPKSDFRSPADRSSDNRGSRSLSTGSEKRGASHFSPGAGWISDVEREDDTA